MTTINEYEMMFDRAKHTMNNAQLTTLHAHVYDCAKRFDILKQTENANKFYTFAERIHTYVKIER